MSTGDPPVDILDQIDAALADATSCLCGCTTALTATSPSPWYASEECQARWGARQIRAKSGIEKVAEPDEAAADLPPTTWTVNPDPVRYRCRTCGSWLSLDVALCGPCDARPKCSATPVAGATVCFLPAGHAVLHEDVEGRRWRVIGRMFEDAPMHPGPGRFTPLGRMPFLGAALDDERPFFAAALDAALGPTRRCETCSMAAAIGFRICRSCLRARGEANRAAASAPPVDAALEPAPDVRPWWRRMLPGGKR